MENSMEVFFPKLKIELLYYSAVPLLDIYLFFVFNRNAAVNILTQEYAALYIKPTFNVMD